MPEAPQHLNVRADLIRPLPSQLRFLQQMYKRKYLLYGGAAGPGKSHILRWGLVEYLMYWGLVRGVRNMRVGLFCEDYPTLKDRHLSKFEKGLINRSDLPLEQALEAGLMEREFPEWLGEVKETRAEGLCFFLAEQFGSGFISFRNLDDPSKYASTEFAAIGVDELTKNPRQTFDDLRFRLRWPGVDHTPFLAASNPGSIGHGWVKSLFIDRDFTGDNERINPDLVEFIPAKPGENIHLPHEYWETLNSLPDDMRSAMLEGNWSIFAGQAFSEWRDNLHIVEPFIIPPDWTRWTATDYGFSAPYCTLWFARCPDCNRIYVYREAYATGVTAKEQALRIIEGSEGERIDQHVADPSMWQTRESEKKGGTSLAAEYAKAGIRLRPAVNDRIAGKGWVHDVLSTRTGQPRLQVFRNCTNLIRTLPALPYDPIRVEDVDTKAEDHCLIGTTRVLTDDGWQAIASVRPGQRVQTRAGWRRVEASWQTGRDEPVLRVRLSNGSALVGTANHRIWTDDGWRRLDALRCGGILESWPKSPSSVGRSRNSKGFATTSLAGTSVAKAFSSIARCGERTTERFLTVTRFITETAIAFTTTLATWNSLLPLSISAGTVASQLSGSARHGGETSSTPSCGTPHLRALSGTVRMVGPSSITGRRCSAPASNAERCTSAATSMSTVVASAVRTAGRSTDGPVVRMTFSASVRAAVAHLRQIVTGERLAAPVSVVSVSDAGRAPVYNLHIAGLHEYYAEGVLVANCYDTLRYGLGAERVTAQSKAPQPATVEVRDQNVLAGRQLSPRRRKRLEADLRAETGMVRTR